MCVSGSKRENKIKTSEGNYDVTKLHNPKSQPTNAKKIITITKASKTENLFINQNYYSDPYRY